MIKTVNFTNEWHLIITKFFQAFSKCTLATYFLYLGLFNDQFFCAEGCTLCCRVCLGISCRFFFPRNVILAFRCKIVFCSIRTYCTMQVLQAALSLLKIFRNRSKDCLRIVGLSGPAGCIVLELASRPARTPGQAWNIPLSVQRTGCACCTKKCKSCCSLKLGASPGW